VQSEAEGGAMSDYPTDQELETVKTWECNTPSSFVDFMEYVQSIGNYWPEESFGWSKRGRSYWVSTGGWSGNEDILEAMRENWTFWAVCWVQHRRGGHYIFKIPDPKVYFRKEPS